MRATVVREFVGGLVLVVSACSLLAETDDLTGARASEIDASGDAATVSDAPPSDAIVDTDGPASDAPASTDVVVPDAANAAYRNAVVADAPIAYFRLDEKAGAACANETGDASYTCTYAGTVAFDRPGIGGGRSIRLENDQSKVSIATATYDFTKPFTIEMWISVDTVVPLQPLADVEVFQPSRSGIYMFTFDASQLRTEIWFAGAFVNYTLATTPLAAQSWHHVAIGYSPPNDFAYVDGVLSTNTGTYDAGGRPNVSTPLVIGGWVGTVDEIAFYDKALSSNRVLAHYALR